MKMRIVIECGNSKIVTALCHVTILIIFQELLS